MRFCGLDVGTTGVKAVVFDETGIQISSAYRAYVIQVESDGTRLLTGQELWQKTKQVLTEIAASGGGDLDALCVGTFGEAFVALDGEDRIISEPMIFTDHWGEEAYFRAEKKTDKGEIARICGLPLSPTYSLSKILFLKEQRPKIYEKIRHIFFIGEFINYLLCGEYGLDYSAACRTMFFDVNTCTWSDDLISRFGLERRHYTDPKPMGTFIGYLREAIRDELGIKGKVKVIIGGHDQTVNAIGSGLRQDHAVCSMGTTECVTPILKKMLREDFIAHNGIPASPLWEKGKFCALAYNSTSGLLVQWFLSLFTDNDELQYTRFDNNLPPDPTKILVQPYLMGSGTPYMDSGARLAMTGIDYGTTKYDLYRAILEGLCLDQKLNMTVLNAEQIFVTHLIAVGGGSKSRAWLEIKAAVLQIPVSTLVVQEAGALGAAVLCSASVGVYGSVEEAAHTMSHIKETIEPDKKNREFYEEKFGIYRKLHEHVKEESAFAAGNV